MNGIEGENESLFDPIEHSRHKQRVDICVHTLHIATDASRNFAKRQRTRPGHRAQNHQAIGCEYVP